MARKKGPPIVEVSREPFKVGPYNNPLKGITTKAKTKKWMETHRA